MNPQKLRGYVPLLLLLVPIATAAYIYTLTLTGTATLVSPALQPSTYTPDFGEVPRGTTAQVTLTVENVGTKKLEATWRVEDLPTGVTLTAYIDGEPWTGPEEWKKGETREVSLDLTNSGGEDGPIAFKVYIDAA